MAKTGFAHEMLKPFLVLVVICVVAAALLGVTHGVTEPIIEEMNEQRALATRQAVLPGAEDFTEVDCDTESLGILSAYKETNGLGYVISASSKGYGGDVTVTMGLDSYGNFTGISANVTSETQGVGSKVGERTILDRFTGVSGNANDVTLRSGATYTSNAVRSSVNAAFEAVAAVIG